MTVFGISLTIWFNLITALVAVAAIISICIAYRKKENPGATVGIILVAAVIGLLIIALFYDIGKEGSPDSKEGHLASIRPSDFLQNLQQDIALQCQDSSCTDCIGATYLSRDWNKEECKALYVINEKIKEISKQTHTMPTLFRELSFFRKEILRDIEIAFEKEGSEVEKDQVDLKQAIAELVVLDQLLIDTLKRMVCSYNDGT